MSDFRDVEKAFAELKRRITEIERREIIKHNFEATTNPGISDDSSENYSVGSLWINTSTGAYFVCLDNTAGSADWNEITTT